MKHAKEGASISKEASKIVEDTLDLLGERLEGSEHELFMECMCTMVTASVISLVAFMRLSGEEKPGITVSVSTLFGAAMSVGLDGDMKVHEEADPRYPLGLGGEA